MNNFVTKVRQVQDVNTGEIFTIEESTRTAYGRKHFWKLYLSDFLPLLGLVMDSQQLNVLLYVLENTKQSDNLFIGTFKKISEETKISLSTVYRIMKKLQNTEYKGAPMIKMVQSGVYMISPDLLVKGNDKKKKSLMITWEMLSDKTIEDFLPTENKEIVI